jgi:dihydroorotase
MKVLIKGAKTLGKYLGDQREVIEADLLIKDGKIASVAFQIDEVADQVILARGLFLSPGLIDPQVHFREPGLEYKEDIESGSKTAVKGGFTTVISMPNTSPTADNAEVVNYMWQKQQEVGLCRVYPTGALSYNLKGEKVTDFAALKKAGAIAITDDGKGVQNDELFLEAMQLAALHDLPILDHSEDESLSQGGSIHEGDHSKKYGVKGIKSSSEAVHVKRGCQMSAKTGAHYHVLHISTKESIDHVKAAKKQGYKVTAEVSPHHLILCDEDIPVKADGALDANWKMNPPLRSKEDRAACVEALIDGTIDAIATDHAPHAPHEKARPIEEAPFGIIGLETAFPLIYTEFVKTGKLSLSRCIELMTEGPAKLFKLPYGTLQVGASADITLLDLDHCFEVKAEDIVSKSKNSPFIGRKLFGHAKLTILEGKIVYNTL